MSDFDLGRSIINASVPSVARDYASLALGSDDPEVKRRYIELAAKLNQKDAPLSGVIVNFTFDMSNGFKAVTTDAPPMVEEVPVEALPAPPPEESQVIDLGAFFSSQDSLVEA